MIAWRWLITFHPTTRLIAKAEDTAGYDDNDFKGFNVNNIKYLYITCLLQADSKSLWRPSQTEWR